jgi:hypothetical protein
MLLKMKKYMYDRKRRKITRKSLERKWFKERKYVEYISGIREVEWWKKKVSIFIRKWVDAFSMSCTPLVGMLTEMNFFNDKDMHWAIKN